MKQQNGAEVTKGSEKSECKMCSKEVSEEDEAIRCDGCEKWTHKECGKVPDEVIEAIEDEVVAMKPFGFAKNAKNSS